MDVDINGITVIFPHKPYDIQVAYMQSVISSLQNKQNALLESPTGTGKTLSLLCSTLAWLEHRKYLDLELVPEVSEQKDYSLMKEDGQSGESQKAKGGKGWKNESPIRIIYSSRTHSQLNQACNELKKCYYKFCPTVTIGSREQLCINPEVTSLESNTAKNQTCRMKVKNNLCKYHNNYERKVSDLSFSGSKIYDIEDMIKFGNENKACPYYLAKAKTDFNTNLIFMPYNYILDPSIRRTLKLNLENAVIIFDEGHNIERVCEDSMSTELKSEWIALFISTFDTALQSLKLLEEGHYDGTNEKELSELNIHDIAKIKLLMCDFEVELERIIKQAPKDQNNQTFYKTEEIFRIFDRVGLDYEKCGLICSVCEKLISFVMSAVTSYMTNTIVSALTSICSFLEIIMPFSQVKGEDLNKYKAEFIKNYRLYIEIENENQGNFKNSWSKKKTQNNWTLNLWCMSPSVAIKSLLNLGVYNLIITSGTLAPLESFECEMGIPFPIKLQNSHVITRSQLSIQLVFKDPNGNDLSGSYQNRNDAKYYSGLGLTILELARNIPKGVFIFFSSYSLINKCIEIWKNGHGITMWNSISSLKQIFVEPRSKTDFNECIRLFKQTVDTTADGAIFMAVSRGKLSEGMDLADDYCRGVIIVGLPYAARFDPKVVLKQKYLDENNAKLNGIKWYMLQMKRALNQSIGRVVRHKNDYGSIIICDSRFKQLNDGLSRWIQAFVNNNAANINTDFRTKMRNIQNFFKQAHGVTIENPSLPALPATKSTSGDSKVQSGAFKSPVCAKTNNMLENAFESIKNGYTSSNAMQTFSAKRSNDQIDSENSVFDSIDYANGSVKKRHPDRNVFARPAQMSPQIKAECDEKSKTEKTQNISKYFSNSPSTERKSNNNKSISHITLIDLEDDDFVCDQKNTNCSSNSCQPSATSNGIEIDFKSDDIVNLMKTLFISERDQNTFKSIHKQINNSAMKCRQLVETFNIYSKKRSATYLALRLNFILDSVANDCRACLLKDLSLIVPDGERRLFLRTCKVDI